MTLLSPSHMRTSFGIAGDDLNRIKDLLQDSVDRWVKNRKDEGFAACDLVGGENYDWNGTPLLLLYQKHIDRGKLEALNLTSCVGWVAVFLAA